MYLDSCHYQIMDKLKVVYANQMKNVEGESSCIRAAHDGIVGDPCHDPAVRQEVAQRNFDDYQSANNLRRCVARLTRQQGDAFICMCESVASGISRRSTNPHCPYSEICRPRGMASDFTTRQSIIDRAYGSAA